MPKKSLSVRTDLVQRPLPAKFDLTGKTFSDWFVIEYAGHKVDYYFKCQCSCGHIGLIPQCRLRKGESRSCGHKGAKYKHGYNKTREFKIWKGIRKRCNNKNSLGYKHYGAKGTRMCSGWNWFPSFLKDMGQRPSPEHSIDRIDGKGHYSCGHCEECVQNGWTANCRWATDVEQNRNSTQNILFTHNGKTLCLAEWCEKEKLPYDKVYDRIHRGQSFEKVVFGKGLSKS